MLFGHLSPAASANALAKALSLAREALTPLGAGGRALLLADRARIWLDEGTEPDIDLVAYERFLRSALSMAPGSQRDVALSEALANDGVLLEDEP